MVFQFLRKNKLYSNLRKCDFHKNKIHYLGHIISKEGVSIDPENIEAIMIWPTPKNVTYVRYFMRVVDYYRICIEGFSKVAHQTASFQRE